MFMAAVAEMLGNLWVFGVIGVIAYGLLPVPSIAEGSK